MPVDVYERPDIAAAAAQRRSQLSYGRNPSEPNEALALASGTSSVSGKLRACHRVLPWLCVGEAEVVGGFSFAWDGFEVTSVWGGWASTWQGNCWYKTWGPFSGYQYGGAPTLMSRVSTAGFDITPFGCPDLGYGGWLQVEPIGIADGGKAITCTEAFTGVWPTNYECILF